MSSVIVDWRRTPFSRSHKGELSEVRSDEFASQVLVELLNNLNINPAEIDDVIVGCAYPEGEQGYNIGRLMALMSGLPKEVPGVTINRLCGSSMQAIMYASANISAGWGECFVCGGIESMSRVKRRGFNWSPHPKFETDFPEAYVNMGITAENVAELYGISRTEQEEFSLLSHTKSSNAVLSGKFAEEIVPIVHNDGLITKDGCIRPNSSLESMSRLGPAFIDGGTVTAATSSPLTDGAVFSLVCSEDFARKNELQPMARIVSAATTGCPPELMGLGPVSSTRLALDRAGWESDEIDVFELNEAFSSQSIACIRELGLNPEIINIDGGALSIGHPLGASGARIACKAASILSREGGKKALASMCIGGGMGISIAMESL